MLGYSFAGILAQLALVEHPGLFRSLTLLTTPPEPGQAFRGVRVIGWLSWFLSGRQGAGLMIWGIVTNKNKVPPSRLAFVRSRFALTRRSSVDDIVGLMKRVPDVREQRRPQRIPVLVATGNHDLWPTHLHAANAQSLGATLAVYTTGHSPCETAPAPARPRHDRALPPRRARRARPLARARAEPAPEARTPAAPRERAQCSAGTVSVDRTTQTRLRLGAQRGARGGSGARARAGLRERRCGAGPRALGVIVPVDDRDRRGDRLEAAQARGESSLVTSSRLISLASTTRSATLPPVSRAVLASAAAAA